jgi:hypothetical protein
MASPPTAERLRAADLHEEAVVLAPEPERPECRSSVFTLTRTPWLPHHRMSHAWRRRST